MYLMFGDEADKDQTANKKFFVYGAIFAPIDSIALLHNEIESARVAAGFGATDSLKSAISTRPKHIAPEKHREVKNEVMKLAEARNVRFCAQVTLHDLARNKEQREVVTWGANTILGQFDKFLSEENSYGYAILDRLPINDPYSYLKEKFQQGMVFTYKPNIRFDRILGFAHGVDGSSHMCSVADVLLGAFRYCVNEPDNVEAGKAMFPTLLSMMLKRNVNGRVKVRGHGLLFRPIDIKDERHKAEYNALAERLSGYLT